MGINMMRFGGSGSINIGRGRTKIWLALPVLALMLAAIALGGLQQGTAYAAEESASGTDVSLGSADGGADSVPNGRPIVAESRGGMRVVWSATLTVGMATDGTTTYLGYGPGLDPPIGNLDDITLTDRGEEYEIENLYHQDFNGTFQQLVLDTNVRLPNDLVFEADGERFALSDAKRLGLNGSIQAWQLDSGMGWDDGDTMTVKLMRPRPYNPCRDE